MGHKRHLFCFILMLHCKTALSGKRSRKSLEKQNGRILCSNRRVTKIVGKVEAGMALHSSRTLYSEQILKVMQQAQ